MITSHALLLLLLLPGAQVVPAIRDLGLHLHLHLHIDNNEIVLTSGQVLVVRHDDFNVGRS